MRSVDPELFSSRFIAGPRLFLSIYMAGAGVNDHMVVGPDDHRAYIVITAIVGLIWSVLVLCIRIFIRVRLTGPFGLDDAAAAIATVCAPQNH